MSTFKSFSVKDIGSLAEHHPPVVILEVHLSNSEDSKGCGDVKAHPPATSIQGLHFSDLFAHRKEGEGTRQAAEECFLFENAPAPAVFCSRGLTKERAEELLDWLEANGYEDRRLTYEPGVGFAVAVGSYLHRLCVRRVTH
jgi:hypothetical protein